jgi:thiol-disulfide isomerase/thioredoxin
MTPTTVQNHFLVTLIAAVVFWSATSGAAQDIQTISHGEQVDITAFLVSGKLTVVDFYADWCGPCRSLAPKLDRLLAANPENLAIRKVDVVNWGSAVADQYRIQSIPHLKLFDENGRLLAEGNAGHVMRLLKNRLGGGGIGDGRQGGVGRSIMPLFALGGLVALAAFLILRSKSPPKPSESRSVQPPRPGVPVPSGWFIMMQDSLEGPFTEEDLEEMLRRREISGGAKTRRRGQSTWTTVEKVVEHLM